MASCGDGRVEFPICPVFKIVDDRGTRSVQQRELPIEARIGLSHALNESTQGYQSEICSIIEFQDSILVTFTDGRKKGVAILVGSGIDSFRVVSLCQADELRK